MALRAPNTSPASQWFGRSCGSCSLTDCETGLRMNGGEGPGAPRAAGRVADQQVSQARAQPQAPRCPEHVV